MKKKGIRYIYRFFRHYNIMRKKNIPIYYYLFLISFFYKYLHLYTYIKKIKFKKRIYWLSNVRFLFKKKNSFLNLDDCHFFSEKLVKEKGRFFIILKRFLNVNLQYLSNKINLYYLNISKKILVSYNFINFYLSRCNRKIFKWNYLKIFNINLKTKIIFGYMKKKKLPRRKKIYRKRGRRGFRYYLNL